MHRRSARADSHEIDTGRTGDRGPDGYPFVPPSSEVREPAPTRPGDVGRPQIVQLLSFGHPVVVRRGRYQVPGAPGYSSEIKRESRDAYRFPGGPVWTALRQERDQ